MPPKSETSWLAAADSWRRSLPTASTSADDGVGGDPAPGAADLVADERRPVAGGVQLRALVERRTGGGEGLDQRLVALAAEVDDDQRQVGVGVARVAGQRVGERAGRTPAPRVTTTSRWPPNSDGASTSASWPTGRPGGGQLVLLGVGVAGEDGGADGGDRPGAQQLLLAHRRRAGARWARRGCGGHDGMLPRAADVPGRAPPR